MTEDQIRAMQGEVLTIKAIAHAEMRYANAECSPGAVINMDGILLSCNTLLDQLQEVHNA